MTDKKIGFALIGCGSITAKHLAALKDIDDAEIVAVCDTNEQVARDVAESHGVRYYTDAHEMVQKETFDVISVLTPSGTHASIVMDLVKYNKHFIIEKPMALKIEDADRIINACDERGLKIFIVQQNRFNMPVRKLKEAIDRGRFGKMVMGTVRVRWCRDQGYYNAKTWRGTWAQDGGVLTNQASHHIDMLVWMLGDVESVMAMTSTRLADIEAEDTGVAVVRFCSGALGVIEATTATRPKDLEGSISILGEKGSVEIGGFFMNELKTWQFQDPAADDNDVFEKWGKNPGHFAWNHKEYLKDVINSLQANRRGLVEGFEGRKSLELINAIYESAETGQMVPIRFRPKYCRLGH
jgi:UDP-N-acetyl-2-amino-2-deoxyglucuronate dehydrogenase